MGLLGKEEASPEIAARIRNSACGQACAKTFCKIFSVGAPHIQWLMASSSKRMLTMKIRKDGIELIQIDRSQGCPAEYGGYTYEVGREGWSFDSSGYQDLPNKEYLTTFVQCLYDQIKNDCPKVNVSKENNYIYITLADNVKKAW